MLAPPVACSRCGFVEPEVRCCSLFQNPNDIPSLRRFEGTQCQLHFDHVENVTVHRFVDRHGDGVAWDARAVARLGR